MAKIRVEISSLRENEKSLEKQIASSEQLSRRLESLLNRIEASWEGDASAAYIRVMSQYAAQAASMRTVLTEFKSYVKNAADTFASKDEKAAARINGSF